MEIVTNLNNGSLILELTGRLDTTTAPLLEAAIKERITEANNVILDFTHVEYISSAGLRVLLITQKALSGKGKLTIAHPSEMVLEVLEMTGFSHILNIEK